VEGRVHKGEKVGTGKSSKKKGGGSKKIRVVGLFLWRASLITQREGGNWG